MSKNSGENWHDELKRRVVNEVHWEMQRCLRSLSERYSQWVSQLLFLFTHLRNMARSSGRELFEKAACLCFLTLVVFGYLRGTDGRIIVGTGSYFMSVVVLRIRRSLSALVHNWFGFSHPLHKIIQVCTAGSL